MNTFNLVDEPWIQVRYRSGGSREVSIREVFHQAESIAGITGELPTQAVAILRLLLAILFRATRTLAGAQPIDAWSDWWDNGLPLAAIDRYLDEWHDRLDLRDPAAPFMQVAGLTTASGSRSGLAKIIGDLPDGRSFFTQRAGSGRDNLSAAEAARWLVHCQEFDPSGIKSGALGDGRVRGGKGYPIGVGWSGKLGLVVLEADDLRNTLLLNLDLSPQGNGSWADPEDDRPVWERPPLGPAIDVRHLTPRGPADLFTWQSRRVLLIWNGADVVDVQISNGDPLGEQNRHNVEMMSGWRRSATQEKKLGLSTVYMPQQHDPSRQIWRGLTAMLDPQNAPGGVERVRPGVLEWLARLKDERLPQGLAVRLRTIGVAYGSNKSVIDAIVDDALDGKVASLTNGRLVALVTHAVADADAAVNALAGLAANLADATDSDKDAARTRAREAGYAALDPYFRTWFTKIDPRTDPEDALMSWGQVVLNAAAQEGELLVEAAGPRATRGRNTSPPGQAARHMDAGKAWMYFQRELRGFLSLHDKQAEEQEANR